MTQSFAATFVAINDLLQSIIKTDGIIARKAIKSRKFSRHLLFTGKLRNYENQMLGDYNGLHGEIKDVRLCPM